jgi:putative DNA primase/helicase
MPFPTADWSMTMSEYQRASLLGRRFVTASEVARRGHLHEDFIKSLTGDDMINARHPYGRPFQFVPVGKFFLRVNEKPIIRDPSHSMWRRVKLISFRQTFTVDTGLATTLAAEAAGILNWMIDGCTQWQREGLREPSHVTAATSAYRGECDPLAEFLSDCCRITTGVSVGGGELFRAYRAWCDRRQLAADDRLSQTAFGTRIKDRFPDIGNSRKVQYSGISLLTPNDWPVS